MKTKYDIGEDIGFLPGEIVLIPAEVRIVEVTPDSKTCRVRLLESNDPILRELISEGEFNYSIFTPSESRSFVTVKKDRGAHS